MQLWKQPSVIRPRPVVFGASSAPVRSCEERYILTRPSTRTRNIRRPGYSCFLFLSCSLLFFVCPLPSTAAVERKRKAERDLSAAGSSSPKQYQPHHESSFRFCWPSQGRGQREQWKWLVFILQFLPVPPEGMGNSPQPCFWAAEENVEEEFVFVSVGCRMVTVKKHQHFN